MTGESIMPTLRISRILAPTDFSELATHALRYASELARRTNAELVVMYADPFLPPPHFTSAQVDTMASSLAMQKANARTELVKYATANISEGVRYRTEVVEDRAVTAIVRAAAEFDADIIVMGTHGRTGFNRLTLGSVTEKVLHETSHPLLAIRPTDRDAASAPASPSILCPVDLTPASRGVFRQALDFAALIGAKVTLLHVRDSSYDGTAKPEELLGTWLNDAPSGQASMRVVNGNPAEAVIREARDAAADLIVLGVRHRPFADTSVIGITTSRITRHAPCPVLAIIV